MTQYVCQKILIADNLGKVTEKYSYIPTSTHFVDGFNLLKC